MLATCPKLTRSLLDENCRTGQSHTDLSSPESRPTGLKCRLWAITSIYDTQSDRKD